MSLSKAVGLHVFIAMYTNHLLTNARPLRSKHLTVLYRLEIALFTLLCCSTNIAHRAPLLDLLTYVRADIAARPNHAPKLANLLLRLLHLRISAISELQYEVGVNQANRGWRRVRGGRHTVLGIRKYRESTRCAIDTRLHLFP